MDIKNFHNGKISVGAFNTTKIKAGKRYGKFSGYNDGRFVKDAIMHFYEYNNSVTIDVDNGKVDSLLNNKYNFMSVLKHEGSENGHYGRVKKHSQVYLNQKKESFYINTTPEFKEHVEKKIKYYKSLND